MLDALVKLEHAHEALCGNSIIDRLPNPHRRRSRPRRILEGEQRAVTDFVDEGQRLLKIVVSLAGEAHDDVRREMNLRNRLPNPVERLEIFLARVEPLHAPQYS